MNILHLTDLHITYDLPEEQSRKKWERIVCSLAESCKGTGIDMLALTGDFTCHGAGEEFRIAEKVLQDILNRLHLTEQQTVMCPGNHDADTVDVHSSFDHYEEFSRSFYQNCDPMQDRKNGRFVFVSVNTCCETSLELYEHATFPEEECRKIQKLSGKETGILLMHHPPETIMNQDAFEEVMASEKIHLILSGHQHMSQPRLYRAGGIAVVGGMAVTPHRKWMAAGAQIIEINERKKVKVRQIDL